MEFVIPKPENHKKMAIICMIVFSIFFSFLYLPFGIASIVKAKNVDVKYYSCDYEGAIRDSKSVKLYIYFGGIICFLVFVIFLVLKQFS